ncbi:DUF3293 domain-containing protein [Castellaniella hirudinis]|uniref:DUF3293 domain-containing protein n=1 Tax=Castellaniella hirudinis TaxID=1144617 RepID=UPI0039C16D30
MPPRLPPALAYQAALYRIDATPALLLRIGQHHPALAALHRQYHSRHSLILTACNPRSRLLRPAANRRRTQALRHALAQLDRPWLPACGLDPTRIWPDEPGFWIPGLPLAQGLGLARRFRQNAIVWCPDGQAAQLVWIPAAAPAAAGLC